MKSLEKYIAESKALHQNINIAESKALHQNINIDEKLLINKDAKIIGIKNPNNREIVVAKDTEDLCNIIDKEIDKFADECPNFSEVLDLNFIDVSGIARFHNLFDPDANPNYGKIKYIDISDWDMSNAEFCSSMFRNAEELISVGDLSNWYFTDKLNTLRGMFAYCYKLNFIGDISNWNVSNVGNFNRMFKECRSLTDVGNLNKWNIREDASKRDMFRDTPLKTPKWYDRNKDEII